MEFDPTKRKGDYDVLPAGEYLVKCVLVEVKTNMAKDGKNLNTRWSVAGDKYNGRLIFDIQSLKVKISFCYNRLADMLEACGTKKNVQLNAESLSDALNEKTCKVRVVVDQYNGKEKNKIEKFLPLSEEESSNVEVSEDIGDGVPFASDSSEWEDDDMPF